MKLITNWKKPLLIFLMCSSLLAPIGFLAVTDPESTFRYFTFRAIYAIPYCRPVATRGYSAFLDEHNAGNMGSPINQFLCSRLEMTSSDEERKTILEFYSLDVRRVSGGIYTISDQAKQRAVPWLLRLANEADLRQAEGALLIIEQMRQGKMIYKAGFGPVGEEWKLPNFVWATWWSQKGLLEAKTKYSQWWAGESEWSQKKMIDPLQNSKVIVTFVP